MGTIYKITNSFNNKVYIGQTRQTLLQRWYEHLWNARNGKDYYLYRAMRKYGMKNFTIEKIEECPNEELNQKEIDYIKKYNSYIPNGYNSTKGGEGNTKYDYNEVIKVYYDCKENIEETCRALNCSYETVSNALKSNNIIPHQSGDHLATPVYECDVDNNILKEFPNFQAVVEEYPELHMTTTGLGNFLAMPRCSRYRGKYFCRVSEYETYKTQNHHNKCYVSILCIEEDKEFETISAAARWIKESGMSNGSVATITSNISKAIKNNWKSYNYTWKRLS